MDVNLLLFISEECIIYVAILCTELLFQSNLLMTSLEHVVINVIKMATTSITLRTIDGQNRTMKVPVDVRVFV